MKSKYSITVAGGISPVGLAKWYEQKHGGFLAGNPVRGDDGLWSFDFDVYEEDCDALETAMTKDTRVRYFAAKG